MFLKSAYFLASHLLILHIGVTVYVRLRSTDILKNNFG